jgi:hypothetical protein
MAKKVSMCFQEKPFLYDWEEWQRWRDPEDKITVGYILDKCGDLVKPRKSILNQVKKGTGSSHYAEVRYALHLETENIGFRDNIIYGENYTLSHQYINECMGKAGLKPIGTNRLLNIFSVDFFKLFDRLYRINKTNIQIQCHNMHVDLCAINPHKKEVHFCEIKKYNLGNNKSEKLFDHQLLFLAFTRYIIDNLFEKAFYDKMYKINTEIIAFVAKDDLKLFNLLKTNPREHLVEFFV